MAVHLSPEQREALGQRLAAGEFANALAREYGVCAETVRRAGLAFRAPAPPPPVRANIGGQRGRSEGELAAATRITAAFESRADAWDNGAPLWHGWSIHQAFLLGVAYARRQARRAP